MMDNVGKFEELLRADEALRIEVEEACRGKAIRDAERALFDAAIAPIAARRGLPFTYEEAVAFARGGIELSAEELEAAAGGTVGCYAIGGSNERTVEYCYVLSDDESYGANACKYVGVGFLAS